VLSRVSAPSSACGGLVGETCCSVYVGGGAAAPELSSGVEPKK
jgi:hypothetical protein